MCNPMILTPTPEVPNGASGVRRELSPRVRRLDSPADEWVSNLMRSTFQ